ncbi:hypothetical protein X941_4876 [Burkholderia pseudomallei MSHR5569]|nr:hypothetical protein X941_4876 [Burkholderia pseudomallei MSHR5569]
MSGCRHEFLEKPPHRHCRAARIVRRARSIRARRAPCAAGRTSCARLARAEAGGRYSTSGRRNALRLREHRSEPPSPLHRAATRRSSSSICARRKSRRASATYRPCMACLPLPSYRACTHRPREPTKSSPSTHGHGRSSRAFRAGATRTEWPTRPKHSSCTFRTNTGKPRRSSTHGRTGASRRLRSAAKQATRNTIRPPATCS